MKKSLGIDAIFPWEIGLMIIVIGIVMIYIGNKQSKKTFDIDKLPLTRPTTKILIGSVLIIFGSVQLIPLLS